MKSQGKKHNQTACHGRVQLQAMKCGEHPVGMQVSRADCQYYERHDDADCDGKDLS
ncbi:hypothetical protein GCM10010924_11720 [Rhizobium wenxiniae]|nr:hypothetical protein GCM10010924_11720 [Rhizobium wenxiniae]